MNPFSKDYKPQINQDQVIREGKISRNATTSRAKNMESPDLWTRVAARGYLGELSQATNYKLAKNSKLG
jgi:hypothetical protein